MEDQDEEIEIKPLWEAKSIIPNNGSTKHQFRCISCGYNDPCFTTILLDDPNPEGCINLSKKDQYEEDILDEIIKEEK